MNLNPYARTPRDFMHIPKPDRARHAPLVLLGEFAEAHGYPRSRVQTWLARTPAELRPRPVFRHAAGTYYQRAALEQWWARRQAQKEQLA